MSFPHNGQVAKDLEGTVALITGANSGIGRVAAKQLALRGAQVLLACRSREKTQPVLDEIAQASQGEAQAEFIPLDLADFDSVRQCADNIIERDLSLNLLICNAGVAGSKGTTKSGFELAFGVCHMGHFLLTTLLLERIWASAPARIVVVASAAHSSTKTIDFETLRQSTQSLTGLPEYSVAKLANILFANELARRLEGSGVTTYALHPGVVATNVWRSVPWPIEKLIKPFMRSEEKGAETTLYCATEDDLRDESGFYYANCRLKEPSALAKDLGLAKKLWEQSEAWVQ